MRRSTSAIQGVAGRGHCARGATSLLGTALALFCVVERALVAAQNEAPAKDATAQPATPPAAAPPAAAPTDVVPKEAAPKDKPANEVPAVFKIDNPLITEEEIKAFNSKQTQYKIAMRNGELDRELIGLGIKTRIYSLTRLKGANEKEKEDGQKIVETLRREIYEAGTILPEAGKRPFREFMLKEVTERCRELLKNHFYPRLQAVVILSNLNIIEPEGQAPPVAYTPAIDLLQDALDEPGQLDGIKVAAVVGMMRINLHSANPPSPTQRIKMAESLIRELGVPTANDWYQARLLEGLGSIEQVNNLQGKPFIVTTIQSVLKDQTRPWRARAAAAKALGRAQLTPDMAVNIYVVDIISLAQEIAEAVNAEDQPKSRFWLPCLFDIYSAFKPTPYEFQAGRKVGLTNKIALAGMGKFKSVVDEGYSKYLPLMNHALAAGEVTNFPEELITPVRDWLQSNAPPDYLKPTQAKQAADGSRQNSDQGVREN